MAKRTKVQINVSDMFLENAHDGASKAAVMRSDLWPIAVAVYGATEGAVKIGPFAGNSFINMMTSEGFSVCGIQRISDPNGKPRYRLLRADGVLIHTNDNQPNAYTEIVASKNPRYIVSKLKLTDPETDVYSSVHHCLRNAKKGAHSLVNYLLNAAMSKLDISKKPMIELDDDLATAVMLMHYDNGTGVTSGHAQGVREAYEDYKAKVVKFKDDVDRMFSLVTTDKWIIVPNTVGGVLIGAVSHHPMHVALENYKEWGEMKPNGVSFTFADVIVPFKWYKNMDCVPSNIRSELDIALMMFYTHINKNSFPSMGSSHMVWEAVETIATNTYNTNSASVFMLPK